jgi:carbohydrate-selective porin OprB
MNKGVLRFLVCFFGFYFCLISFAGAQTLEERVSRLEQQFNGSNLLDGMNLGVGATMIIQGTSNANASGITTTNNSYKGDDRTDASYSLDIELEKAFDDIGATAFLHIETGEGAGVTDDIEVFSNVNRDVDASGGALAVTELWWEQNFDDIAMLTFGKIDATGFIDTNEYANDECGQFLGNTFRNSPVVEFPDNTFGIRLGLDVTDILDVETVIADGDADFNQIADNPWIAVQANLKPELMDRPGNYRIIFWNNEAAHTKWTDTTKTKEAASGFGISLDQEVADDVGVFLRAGWRADDVFIDSASDGISAEDVTLESAYSAGVQFSGNLWEREDDVCGFAYGIINPSDEYKKAQSRQAKTESHFEAYYKFVVNEHLEITPDVQIISNPFGKDAPNGTSTIIVGGIRTQINF